MFKKIRIALLEIKLTFDYHRGALGKAFVTYHKLKTLRGY